MKEVVRTEAAPAPFQGAPYSQAIVSGGLVFVSGQLSLRPGPRRDRRRHHPGADRAGLRESGRHPRGGRVEPRPAGQDDGLPGRPERLPGDERGLRAPRRRPAAGARDDRGLRLALRAPRSRSKRSRSFRWSTPRARACGCAIWHAWAAPARLRPAEPAATGPALRRERTSSRPAVGDLMASPI